MTSPRISEPLVQSFNTHRMGDDLISALMTGRGPERDTIVAQVRANLKASPGNLQHVIIYGARGFGKSFLVRAVQMELRKLAEKDALAFVLLPEEQHNLVHGQAGLLEYVSLKLRDLRTGADESWKGARFSWPDPEKARAAWEKAEQELERELDASFPDNKGLAVVVVENFDFLLGSVFKEKPAQQLLRKWLARQGNRCMLLATATGAVDLDYDQPLFQAFLSLQLPPWSREECIEYFNRRRDLGQRPPLDAEEQAKVRAIADFIGGTPRLAQLLADVFDVEQGFKGGDPLSVAAIMDALVDKLAEYYRNRLEDLPPLARGLLDALIRGGEPCSATELAQRVGTEQNVIARVVRDLQRADMIRGLPAPQGREKLFRVVDRVFAHYYRVRQGQVQAVDSPLSTILDFLRAFYSQEEHKAQARRFLEAGRPAEADVFARLALEGAAARGFNTYRRHFVYRLSSLLLAAPEAWHGTAHEVEEQLDTNPAQLAHACATLPPTGTPLENAVRAAVQAQACARMGLTAKAEEILDSACEQATDDPAATIVVASEGNFFFASEKKAWRKAEQYAALVREQHREGLAPVLQSIALRDQARILDISGPPEEALAAATEAAELAAQAGDVWGQAMAMQYKASALGSLDRHEEAVATATEAAKLAAQAGDTSEQAWAMRLKASILNKTARFEEAFSAAHCAFDLALSVGAPSLISATVFQALRAAGAATLPEIPELLERWFEWAGAWLAPLSRHERRAWFEENLPNRLILSLLGQAIARVGADKGRAAGFEAAHNILSRLAGFFAELPEQERPQDWLTNIGSAFARGCHDAGLLRDVAGLLRGELAGTLPTNAKGQAGLLEALAVYEEAGERRQDVLARTDPDVALWIRRIRDLPEEQAPPPKRRKRRK